MAVENLNRNTNDQDPNEQAGSWQDMAAEEEERRRREREGENTDQSTDEGTDSSQTDAQNAQTDQDGPSIQELLNGRSIEDALAYNGSELGKYQEDLEYLAQELRDAGYRVDSPEDLQKILNDDSSAQARRRAREYLRDQQRISELQSTIDAIENYRDDQDAAIPLPPVSDGEGTGNETGDTNPEAQENLDQREALRGEIAEKQAAIDNLKQSQQELLEMVRQLKESEEGQENHEQLNDKERIKDDIERKEREIEEARKRLDDLKKERDALLKEGKEKEGGKDKGEDDDEKFFFAAINVNMQDELRAEAHRLADEAINAEVAQKGFLTKLWKGNFLNKFYKERYAQQLMTGKQTVELDGKQVSLAEKLKTERGQEHLSRMIGAIVDSATFMHEGEEMSVNDAETARVKDAIHEYYDAIQAGIDPKEAEKNFEQAVGYNRAKARDDGEVLDDATANNYLEIAKNAIKKVNHEVSLDNVLEGFYVYDAKVTDAVHSSEHNNKIDNMIEKLEGKSGVGMVLAQAAAAAVGIASAFSNAGAKALGGVGVGIAATGILAGGKAYHKATVDRATMMRRAALGLESSYELDNPEEMGNRRARKTAKYEAKIGGTVYEMATARDLTNDLNEAINSGDYNAILRATANMQARIDFSENEDKDLIAYSSAANVGKEDLEMRRSLFMAKDLLAEHENGREDLKLLQKQIMEQIREDVEDKDTEFTSERRKVAAKAALKSVAIGTASFFGSQEIGALINPNQIGLLEKFNLVQTQNNLDAKQTILTELFTGPRTYVANTVVNVPEDDLVRRNALKSQGYTETQTKAAYDTTTTTTQQVPAVQANGGVRVNKIDWANNGTSWSDYNELSIKEQGGHLVVGAFDSRFSTLPNGTQINVRDLMANNQLSGLVTFNGKKFLVESLGLDSSGHPFFDNNGIINLINPANGAKVGTANIANFAYDQFSIGTYSVNPNGSIDWMSLATDVMNRGKNTLVEEAITVAQHFPAEFKYELIKQAGMATEGIFIPTSPVDSLGQARQKAIPPEPTPINIEEDDDDGGDDGDPPVPPTPPTIEGEGGQDFNPVPPPPTPNPIEHDPVPPTPPTIEGEGGQDFDPAPLPPTPDPINQLPPDRTRRPIGELPPAETDQPYGELPPARNDQNARRRPNGELPAPQDTDQPNGELPAPQTTELARTDNDASGPLSTEVADLPPNQGQTGNQTTSQTEPADQTEAQNDQPEQDETGAENQNQIPDVLARYRDGQDFSLSESILFDRLASYTNELGSRGVLFLTDAYSNPDYAGMYENWYNGLSDSGRAALADAMRMFDEYPAYKNTRTNTRQPSDMGRAFREWYNNRAQNNPNAAN